MDKTNTKLITVYTPTFNRAYCLPRLYESLIKQSSDNFKWLIIDDGSTDLTKDLVQEWIINKKLEIEYIYQNNQGMHGAHNSAIDLIDTELNICIDSDDFMPKDAIEIIEKSWNLIENKNQYAGIIGLDGTPDGNVLGSKLPKKIASTTLENLYHKYHVRGDKKLVYRSDVLKGFRRYPIYREEKFVPLGTLYLMIDKEFEMLCLNEILCVVEYQEDGSSKNIYRQYLRNPKGFKYARKINYEYSNFFKIKIKSIIHFISHSIHEGNGKLWKETPNKLLTFLLYPLGFLLSKYVLLINKIKYPK